MTPTKCLLPGFLLVVLKLSTTEAGLLSGGKYVITINSLTKCPDQGTGAMKIQNLEAVTDGENQFKASAKFTMPIPYDGKLKVKVVADKMMGGKWKNNFISIPLNGCKAINQNSNGIINGIFKAGGSPKSDCDHPPGTYEIKDYAIDATKFTIPPVVPTGRYRANVQCFDNANKIMGCFSLDFGLKK